MKKFLLRTTALTLSAVSLGFLNPTSSRAQRSMDDEFEAYINHKRGTSHSSRTTFRSNRYPSEAYEYGDSYEDELFARDGRHDLYLRKQNEASGKIVVKKGPTILATGQIDCKRGKIKVMINEPSGRDSIYTHLNGETWLQAADEYGRRSSGYTPFSLYNVMCAKGEWTSNGKPVMRTPYSMLKRMHYSGMLPEPVRYRPFNRPDYNSFDY